MSKEKIEEVACENCLHHLACLVNSEYVPTPCCAYEDKAGYRKQSDGEWVRYGYDSQECSLCGSVNTNYLNNNFCPNCGAKMKGGE